jgi:predicted ribosome quality control (RQC) complex YloA/Tae2 family protein
LKEILKDG